MAKEYLTDNTSLSIDISVKQLNPDKVLVVTDRNVEKKVFPLLCDSKVVKESDRIVISEGENSKNLETVVKVWDKLEDIQATRNSLVLNIGGGLVSDVGGFAAATFKRGIRTINVPTTLLGAVDAASGGKTGINYHGLKNEIGAFHLPSKVIVSVMLFSTLNQEEILSGYAEMVKTAIISDREFYISLLDIEAILSDEKKLGEAVEKCIRIKDKVVESDPEEKGLRKILNFGHTAGHAFESIRLQQGKGITHGKAVAHGMLVALILSHMKLGLSAGEISHYANFLKNNYGPSLFACQDLDDVVQKINNDKKNRKFGQPLFSLLSSPGNPEINCSVSQSEIKEALEIYKDFL